VIVTQLVTRFHVPSLEGFECGDADQRECSSEDVSVCPPRPAASLPPSNLMRTLILAGQVPLVTVKVAEQRFIPDGSWS
jgi:hypothetical protein